jgi:peptidoglycan/xylan/chitin deacetylase (PgdA/CDA1 family)
MLKIIKTLNISHTPEPTNSEPTGTESKVVALTFDDGPNPHATPKILDILKSENVKATFFLIGKWVKKYPELAGRIVSEGHTIGGHTYSHGGEDGKESWGDFKKGNDTIKEITGVDVRQVRVPQFGYNEIETIDGRKVARIQELTEGSLAEDIASGKLSVIDCSINPNDWNVLVPSLLIREYVLFRLHPGAIICLHDGSEKESELKSRANRTVRMLPDLIREIKERGYGFAIY